ncbi:hypothetical protein FT663_04145 [Candidozyma haemuli var. vulneris]|uniref:CFEM domain-containing protein n=1 Tax=Candidozyma haemuli TaxID=45357 RepID=A0A2V1ATR1_9ASCO|nr:hypothetical protein CXQ85_004177 [[Candida] haemuloni]KAF3985947.1 hypothetical protein FT662_04850 [[Candida] haemuloni var. vulneris]KAF3988175.1 hypothetical protein FT663_04145 [[Candida] haemuloni var. vulneris]PVH20673.1 hypothetical protein CXQ85_004177 [[Candida] haemuloni]
MISALPFAALVASVLAADNQWATYPSVPHTATINGFADPVFDSLPECAKPCVDESTSSTPCPYWDTGCLCVMTTWSSKVTNCYAEKCSGSDAQKAFDASVQICKNAGVWEPYWIVNDAASAAISSAAAKEDDKTSSAAPETTSSAPAQETQDETTTQGEATSATSSQAEQTEAPAETSAPAESEAPAGSAPAESASAPAESSAAVSSFEGAAAGAGPAGVAVGVAAGLAMLL